MFCSIPEVRDYNLWMTCVFCCTCERRIMFKNWLWFPNIHSSILWQFWKYIEATTSSLNPGWNEDQCGTDISIISENSWTDCWIYYCFIHLHLDSVPDSSDSFTECIFSVLLCDKVKASKFFRSFCKLFVRNQNVQNSYTRILWSK